MVDWTTFAAFAVVVLGFLLVLSHLSQQAFEPVDSERAIDPSRDTAARSEVRDAGWDGARAPETVVERPAADADREALGSQGAPDGETPTPEAYARFDRFFDAELRAISAHVLFPVGERTTRYVIETHTADGHKITYDMDDLHATEIRGRGFLVVPVAEPREWDGHGSTLVEAIERLRGGDYEQMVDLGRFIPNAEPYFVR